MNNRPIKKDVFLSPFHVKPCFPVEGASVGIVHGDLFASNTMRGKDRCIKLIGFGVCGNVNEELQSSHPLGEHAASLTT